VTTRSRVEFVDKLASGKVRGRRKDFALTQEERFEFELAKVQGWAMDRGGRRNLYNVWREYCHAICWPFVVIHDYAKRKKVGVDCDTFPYSAHFDVVAHVKFVCVAKRMRLPDGAHFTIWPEGAFIGGVCLRRAEKIAKWMTEFTRKWSTSNDDEPA
jgi:hypothetical protein